MPSPESPRPPVIEIEGLGKDYVIGAKDESESFRELLTSLVTSPLARFRALAESARAPRFKALDDVTLSVAEGSVVGIIGRNGAGKSTLLKILAGITEPTRGRVVMRGRTASLLEVGTGFHHELTGRENIFLNGSILGMRRREIERKFDEIVGFAEIEEFLDTPVKRYSSGMYMRLAFAVAAHLEPEILLVDEVLAVGDAVFQKKCLGKMSEVAQGGRTVLFVSHNMNAVEELVDEIVWIDRGRVREHSRDVRGAIHRYLQAGNPQGTASWAPPDENPPRHPLMTPRALVALDGDGRPLAAPARADAPIPVRLTFDLAAVDPALTLGIAVYDEDERVLFWSYHTDGREPEWPALKIGENVIETAIPAHLLNEGTYSVELIGGLHAREWFFEPRRDVPRIQIEVRGGLSASPLWIAARPGTLAPVLPWRST